MSPKKTHRPRFSFTLYVAGESATSEVAIANLKKIENGFGEEVSIEVIDIEASPDIALKEGVNLFPTLVRTQPAPTRRLIGDLSNIEKSIQFLKKGIEEGK